MKILMWDEVTPWNELDVGITNLPEPVKWAATLLDTDAFDYIEVKLKGGVVYNLEK